MSRLYAPLRLALFALLAFGFVSGFGLSVAHADKVHAKFKNKIILSESPFPDGFKSDGAMISYLKKVNKDKFIKNKKGVWNIEYMAFLKDKLNQKEAVIMFFDVTYGDADPEEVYSTGLRPDDAYTKIVAGYLTLDPTFFETDHKYQMTISRGRGTKPLASVVFALKD